MRLKGQSRRREESLPELAEAYPNAAVAMIELLAKDQFINAIPDDETCLKIRQSRPDSFRRVLETA